MGKLEFKYSADQQYQLDAIDAVCDLFRGQEFLDARFTAVFDSLLIAQKSRAAFHS